MRASKQPSIYTNEELKAAEMRGKDAYTAGRMNIPALDHVFLAMLKPGAEVGTGIPMLKAWQRGWYQEMHKVTTAELAEMEF